MRRANQFRFYFSTREILVSQTGAHKAIKGRIGTDELLVQHSRILRETLSHNTESSTMLVKENRRQVKHVWGCEFRSCNQYKAYPSHKHRQIARSFKFGAV
jgi:hypothetical protein